MSLEIRCCFVKTESLANSLVIVNLYKAMVLGQYVLGGIFSVNLSRSDTSTIYKGLRLCSC